MRFKRPRRTSSAPRSSRRSTKSRQTTRQTPPRKVGARNKDDRISNLLSLRNSRKINKRLREKIRRRRRARPPPTIRLIYPTSPLRTRQVPLPSNKSLMKKRRRPQKPPPRLCPTRLPTFPPRPSNRRPRPPPPTPLLRIQRIPLPRLSQPRAKRRLPAPRSRGLPRSPFHPLTNS